MLGGGSSGAYLGACRGNFCQCKNILVDVDSDWECESIPWGATVVAFVSN